MRYGILYGNGDTTMSHEQTQKITAHIPVDLLQEAQAVRDSASLLAEAEVLATWPVPG